MDVEDVRLAVYRTLQLTGRAPRLSALAAELATDEGTVRRCVRELAEHRHLVLDKADNIVMAHPFSAVPLGFSVMGKATLWWGGCCWDSFALAHLLPEEGSVLIATRCPGCDRAGAWDVSSEAPPVGDWWAHFLVPVARMWDDVVHTCAHQRLFCSTACIDDWCASSRHQRGFVMDLATLWRLASHWYDGRLDRGYVRREPTEAAAYLREVGLHDPFWGTA
jgi:hypothetical protein